MSETSTREYTENMRGRYARMTGKSALTRLIDEYVAVTGYERKYVIKVLRGTRRREGAGRRCGSPRRYDEATDRSLKRLWRALADPVESADPPAGAAFRHCLQQASRR